MTQITQAQYLQSALKSADTNLHLLATIIQLGEAGQIQINDGLREMLDFTLELNWQLYQLTKEKIKDHGILL